MSTTPYHSDDTNGSSSQEPRKKGPSDTGSKVGKSHGSQPRSPSIRGDGNYSGGRCEFSDDDLITAAQMGNQIAFVELCRRHSAVTKKMILRIVRNNEDAEDALQDTLLRAYTHLSSFRGSCKFSSWLTTIGVNTALMIMRKRRVRKDTYASTSSLDTGTVDRLEPVERSLGPEGIYLKQQASLLVRRAVEKLHPSLRSVIRDYYGSECSLEEAAKAQEISLAAAKSRLLRGRVRLRSSLARYGISSSLQLSSTAGSAPHLNR